MGHVVGSRGVLAPRPEWGPHFQMRRLSAWTGGLRGMFSYARGFHDL